MKTDIDIKDDIYMFIKGSRLNYEVNGKLSKTKRPVGSSNEDIVISILANQNGEIQKAFVNVNIYVKDVIRNNQNEEDTIRLRELCGLAEKTLKIGRGDDFRFILESQRVLEVDGKKEHLINNKLLYMQCNQ